VDTRRTQRLVRADGSPLTGRPSPLTSSGSTRIANRTEWCI
jgi:hypothetical protein